MKSEVYRRKVDTRDELPDLVMDVIVSIKERPDAFWRATYHVLTPLAKCIDVDGGIFENVRGLLEKYPTFGREKETGLLGALDT